MQLLLAASLLVCCGPGILLSVKVWVAVKRDVNPVILHNSTEAKKRKGDYSREYLHVRIVCSEWACEVGSERACGVRERQR